MKIRTIMGALLTTAALAAPLAAQNEYKAFDGYCVLGSFQVCASVRLYSEGNTLRMRVWNLEGTLGTSHTMTAIGLYHSGTPWVGTLNSYGVNYNGTDITSKWAANAGDISNLGGIALELKEGTKGNAGIIGCTDPGGSPDKWMTCNSFDGQPYVELTFNLSSHFAMDGTELRWHSQQIGPNSISLKCDTGGLSADGPCAPPPLTTPEPVTMVLLGSGLAGVGAAARRRKANKATETEV